MNATKNILVLLDGSPDSNRCVNYLIDCKISFLCCLFRLSIQHFLLLFFFKHTVVRKDSKLILLNCIETVKSIMLFLKLSMKVNLKYFTYSSKHKNTTQKRLTIRTFRKKKILHFDVYNLCFVVLFLEVEFYCEVVIIIFQRCSNKKNPCKDLYVPEDLIDFVRVVKEKKTVQAKFMLSQAKHKLMVEGKFEEPLIDVNVLICVGTWLF